ncbi:MAG: hypothetical protein ACLQAT_18795 [Candidatus Binataceae bacterium]
MLRFDNLPPQFTVHDLVALIEQHGAHVGDSSLGKFDGATGSKTFGFCDVLDWAADRAIAALDGSEIDGHVIHVFVARTCWDE